MKTEENISIKKQKQEKEQTKEFIRFLKGLDEKQQMGLHLTIEGLQVLFEKQKKRHENR